MNVTRSRTNDGTREQDSPLSRYMARYNEGLLLVLLMIAYVSIPAFAVQFGGWENQYVPVGVAGIAGTITGVLLAKSRMSEAVAHFLGVILGVLVVGILTLLNADMLAGPMVERAREFGTLVVDWYLGRQESGAQQTLLVSFLLGLLVWLFAFLSTWSLFRRGWLLAGLLLPAALSLVNFRYAPTNFPWTLVLMLALAIPIAARMHFQERERRWARRRIASPVGLGTRFVIVGTVLGILITLVATQTPPAWSRITLQPLVEEVAMSYNRATDRASEWLDGLSGDQTPDLSNAGSYTAFDDAFSIGGPLDLSDQPEVLVQTSASQAPYLTAHTYDLYTGRGWASTTSRQFADVETERGRLAPELLFREGQSVVLSDDVTGSRIAQSTTITPLSGPSGVVFSVDTYLTSDIQTVVRMSWQPLDDTPFAIATDTLNALPPDIQRLSNLLLQAELSGVASSWGPEATSAAMQQEIENEVDALASRGLLVRWETMPDGIISDLYVTGRIPVFDDVEAIYPRNPEDAASGSSYRVRSLTSTAAPEDLASAPTAYPAWVTERYLGTGDTLTERTRMLAMDVVGDAVDPYTQAVRVEAFLREHITYNEQVMEPPTGADLVDFVLFEDSQGYCEHYSASMTIMMRSLGVPARTVVGYYPGEYDDAQDGYVYRQLNAHAWTEVFFPGYGWIPFEPTANRPLEERSSTVVPEETEAPQPTEVVPTPDVEDENLESTPVPEERSVENPGPPEQVFLDDAGDSGRAGWILPLAGVATVAAVLGGIFWFAWNWRLRGLSPAEALFTKARRVGSLGGVRQGPTTTPREYAHRFSEEMPAMGTPVRKIVQVYEADTYGPSGADAGSLAVAREAWQELRQKALRMVVRIRRKRRVP